MPYLERCRPCGITGVIDEAAYIRNSFEPIRLMPDFKEFINTLNGLKRPRALLSPQYILGAPLDLLPDVYFPVRQYIWSQVSQFRFSFIRTYFRPRLRQYYEEYRMQVYTVEEAIQRYLSIPQPQTRIISEDEHTRLQSTLFPKPEPLPLFVFQQLRFQTSPLKTALLFRI